MDKRKKAHRQSVKKLQVLIATETKLQKTIL